MNNALRSIGWLSCTALLLGCTGCSSSNGPRTDAGGEQSLLIIVSPGIDVGMRTNARLTLRVALLQPGGAPQPGAAVSFAISGEARGSTLSHGNAYTNGQGEAETQVQAGPTPARFTIQASADEAQPVTFYIEVSDAGFSALQLSGQYQGALPSAYAAKLLRVVYLLYGDRGCSEIDLHSPPDPLRSRVADSLDQQISLASLPHDQRHTVAVVASRGMSSGVWQPRAAGCVEFPAGALSVCEAACPGHQALVALHDLQPEIPQQPLQLRLSLPVASRALAEALTPYQELFQCPLAPEQQLLDCIIDAVDSGDPLDCNTEKPSAAASALLAARGTLQGLCREAASVTGAQSLEQTMRQLASPPDLASVATQVGQIEGQALDLLRELQLRDTLVVHAIQGGASGQKSSVLFDHSINQIDIFSEADKIEHLAAAFGQAGWAALAQVGNLDLILEDPWNWQLTLGEHDFVLRYGILARSSLGPLVFSSLGLPLSSGGLVELLSEQYRLDSIPAGCQSLDAAICPAARLPAGCLAQACPQGLLALADRLEQGFAQIEQPPSVLRLKGTLMLKDTDGDLKIDQLTAAGWTAVLRLGQNEILQPSLSVEEGQK